MEATADGELDRKEAEQWEPDLGQVRIEDLPEGFRGVAEDIGIKAALALIAEWGGRKVTVPANPGEPLRKRLGNDACAQLCDKYSGARIHVPSITGASRRARDRAIQGARVEGMTVPMLMRRFRLSERRVQGILAGRR